jgi:hydrogenase small subunit
MQITRRSFLQYCTAASATLGISAAELFSVNRALANPAAPSVIWVQGSGCTGCSISFLNYISDTAPQTAADVLISSINLLYHPNLSAAAGSTVSEVINKALATGNFILIVEGGVPTAFGGHACSPWSSNGREVTFLEAVTSLAGKASKIICVGNCASFGGVSASGLNPTGVKSVSGATGKNTINIAGCPPHPNWIVWAVVQLLQGKSIAVDSYKRPTYLYSRKVHDQCPLRETDEIGTFGVSGRCLKALGCRGPEVAAPCAVTKWNNGVNWCVGAGAPCIGCTSASFPGSAALYRR